MPAGRDSIDRQDAPTVGAVMSRPRSSRQHNRPMELALIQLELLRYRASLRPWPLLACSGYRATTVNTPSFVYDPGPERAMTRSPLQLVLGRIRRRVGDFGGAPSRTPRVGFGPRPPTSSKAAPRPPARPVVDRSAPSIPRALAHRRAGAVSPARVQPSPHIEDRLRVKPRNRNTHSANAPKRIIRHGNRRVRGFAAVEPNGRRRLVIDGALSGNVGLLHGPLRSVNLRQFAANRADRCDYGVLARYVRTRIRLRARL